MNLRTIWVAALTVAVGFGVAVGEAQAKRFGGGGSFGGKQSFSSPQKRADVSPQQPGGQPATAPGAPAQGGAAPAKKGFGMGGILGGLLAGGLLAALFAGGAFENINFMDVLIIGGILLLVFMLFARRRAAPQPQYAGAPGDTGMGQQRSGFEELGSGKAENEPVATTRVSAPHASVVLPKGFDDKAFLEEAKSLYVTFQKAWDSGELAELRGRTTDAVFGEIQDQFRGRQGSNETEVIHLDASVIRVNEVEKTMEASVLFSAQLREIDHSTGLYPAPIHVQEIWHFVRPTTGINPQWYLDGIQQVEE